MICTALSHRSSPRQRDRAVANLRIGEGTTEPVMPDVRTPVGWARASRAIKSPPKKLEAPSAGQTRWGSKAVSGRGGRGTLPRSTRTSAARCRYLN